MKMDDHDHRESLKKSIPHTQTYISGKNGEAIKLIEHINLKRMDNEQILEDKINEIIDSINQLNKQQ